MTMYGPFKSPEVIAAKAVARKKLLERIRRQRIQNAQAFREKLLRAAAEDPDRDSDRDRD